MNIEKTLEIAKRGSDLRNKEREVLERIAASTSVEFAAQAAEELDSKKHVYSFETYVAMLQDLEKCVRRGLPNCVALQLVQSNIGQSLLEQYLNSQGGNLS